MYCIIKCIVQGKQARVKNADLRHPSCTVVMYKRKSASPFLNVLNFDPSFTRSRLFEFSQDLFQRKERRHRNVIYPLYCNA